MDKKTIINEFNKYEIPLSDEQGELFLCFLDFLLEENKKYNLTAITEESEVVIKHFIDSCLTKDLIKDFSSIVDIGAGAGFPGIPLAILKPDCSFVLVDSLRKRTDFLNSLIERLNLKNCKVVWGRSEDLAQKSEYRESFDYCVARAVARLSTLCEYCLPFIKVGGKMLAYKSKDGDIEIKEASNAIKTLGAEMSEVKIFNLEGMDRKIVSIVKINNTPKKYPRNQNKPKTNSL